MDALACRGLVVNRPDFFADPGFRQWLANDAPKFTWFTGGEPDEYSDVVVLVDPSLNGEGSDSDMPAGVWRQIVEICRAHLGAGSAGASHYMVRLTNLSE